MLGGKGWDVEGSRDIIHRRRLDRALGEELHGPLVQAAADDRLHDLTRGARQVFRLGRLGRLDFWRGCGRFGFAFDKIAAGSNAETAVQIAFGILVVFMLAAISAVVGGALAANLSGSGSSYRQGLQKIWPVVDRGTLILLILGIILTFVAVLITEGPPFSDPIAAEVWMNLQTN